MNNKIEVLQIRITRLKRMVAEISIPANLPDELKHILRTAPTMLSEFEDALRLNIPAVTAKINDLIDTVETNIEWAVGTVGGNAMAEAIKSGVKVDPSLPVDQRLLTRISTLLMSKIDERKYLSLVREFAGNDAIRGNTIYMDPGEETDAFSQWMIHDIILPGESNRLIETFDRVESTTLPEDELKLLKERLEDRPSIYRVIEMEKARDIYHAQDLLSPDVVIRIRDKSTSRSLHKGSVFAGRAIPIHGSDGLFNVLGSIMSYPPKLWSILSGSINKWSKVYFEKNPNSTRLDFFRVHHARLRCEIRDIVELHS